MGSRLKEVVNLLDVARCRSLRQMLITEKSNPCLLQPQSVVFVGMNSVNYYDRWKNKSSEVGDNREVFSSSPGHCVEGGKKTATLPLAL